VWICNRQEDETSPTPAASPRMPALLGITGPTWAAGGVRAVSRDHPLRSPLWSTTGRGRRYGQTYMNSTSSGHPPSTSLCASFFSVSTALDGERQQPYTWTWVKEGVRRDRHRRNFRPGDYSTIPGKLRTRPRLKTDRRRQPRRFISSYGRCDPPGVQFHAGRKNPRSSYCPKMNRPGLHIRSATARPNSGPLGKQNG